MKLTGAEKVFVNIVNAKQKAELMEDIARLIEQDLSLPEIANDFETYGSNLEKIAGKRMRMATSRAVPIHTAFEGVISQLAVQTLKSGDSSGDMGGAFRRAAAAIESSEGLFGMLVMAYVKPILAIVVILLGVGAFSETMLLQMKGMVPFAKWPLLTRMLDDFSTWINENRFVIIGGVGAFFTLIFLMTTQLTGTVRQVFDKFPFFKQYRLLQASSFLNQLATMLEAGMPLLQSVEWAKDNQGKYGKYHCAKMARAIREARQSGNLGKVLNTGLLSEREINRLSRPVDSGMMGDLLFAAGKSHTLQLQRSVNFQKALTQYLPMAFFVLMLLWVFSGMLFLVLSMT